MIERIDNLKLNIFKDEKELLSLAQKKYKKPIKHLQIIKKSLDARDKNNIFWVYSVAVSSTEINQIDLPRPPIKQNPQVAIIGSGPAGLMCALRLVDLGFKPLIFERGKCVEERKKTIDEFIKNGTLNQECNVQFGEGGAGTYSDGKLNTQTKDGLNKDVLKLFAKFGAPQEILYLNKPHVGSDVLYDVLKNARKYVEDRGGRFYFNSKFVGFEKCDEKIKTIIVQNVENGQTNAFAVDEIVLAIGHSARDTFQMLSQNGVAMESKDFAIGVRIEHLQKEIGFAQYGKYYKNLPTADYKLTSHAHERTVFTFCMCPGGVVIPAASEEGGVVVNGMSNFNRDGENANSALMVQMKKTDFDGDDLFAGMRFQRKIENLAYESGGRNYCAPVQLYGDFARDKTSSKFGSVKPTYARGTTFAPLNEILPTVCTQALKVAIPDMDKRLKGFANPDAVLTGVETRFSSPVKILRDANCQSQNFKNLYPCGEGSGYSGGITSSAADGLRVAEILYQKYNA